MNDVDVVIPAFDAEAYLAEAIGSVLAQSQAQRVARIVVVDDASRDGTSRIARETGAPVELIRFDVNRGAAAARNAGIAAARAPRVAFLDADDRWLPGKLAAQCAALDADPALAFVLCGIAPFVSPDLDAGERAALAVDARPAEGWMASALLARRDVFDEIGGFPEDLRVGEVIDWFSRARALPHVVLGLTGVERRLHRHNSTRRARVSGQDYLDVLRRHRARTRARDDA